ncbi:TolC family protein [Undibacterium terreum]|uniref:Copper resistance-related lipoprotein n=1 Tax=Undibacterium terreum TaxID=1224302 RepID=A0A916U8X4_9BURK|nr:TolC family protein [Undibacterium terreum]GGC63522.1 copper resistance-related lipoprotein [Undibacterium terreum]
MKSRFNINLRHSRLTVAAALPLLLGACASFSTDGGFASVEQVAKSQLNKDISWQREDSDKDAASKKVQELLASPLGVEDAVQIALLNNRGLQAAFYELGISEAEFVQSGRLANPGFSFGRLRQGSDVEIDRGLQFNIAQLLTMPYVRQMEGHRFEQAKRDAAGQVLSLAAETRKAYYMAVAADESMLYMQQVKKAADAGSELARRMQQAGNFNKLQQAREQGFYADAALSLARAEQAQLHSREKLTRLMGLWGEQTAFVLPVKLPDLPKAPQDMENIEQLAMSQRLDVQAARLGTEQLAKNLGLSKVSRFINVLEVGAVRNSYREQPTERGYQITLELPLFDWGSARVAKAEALYMQAVNRTAETAVNARSEVREAYLAYRSSYDIARHYRDEILPLKKRISEENQLRYNGMLIGVFDLLADARSQMLAVNGAIEAKRDFWLAQADLEMSLLGKPALGLPAANAMQADSPAAGH